MNFKTAAWFALWAVLASAEPHPPSRTITTEYGPVQGFVLNNVEVFKNVPFAAPPEGPLRFKSPQPPKAWTEVRKESTPDSFHMCPQFKFTKDIYFGSEDCLYLDVYVPAAAQTSAEPLAVLVWFYGGAFVLGDKNEFFWYTSTKLANKHNVIAVQPNYRVGPFGFIALDQLRAENPDNSTGNYALQDQTFALRWVQQNIARFGGDPKRVAIFGESAGSWSVCSHLVLPASKGLFHAAILESGGCEMALNYSVAKWQSEDYMRTAGCPHTAPNFTACIRALPVGKLLMPTMPSFDKINQIRSRLPTTAQSSAWLPSLMLPMMMPAPCIDFAQTGLSGRPIDLIKQGKWHKVPVIMGSNKDESSIMFFMLPLMVQGLWFPMTQKNYEDALALMYLNNTQTITRIKELYPRSKFNSWDEAWVRPTSDSMPTGACYMRRAMNAVISSGGERTSWLYQFVYQAPWSDAKWLGDPHTWELQFIFDDNGWPPLVHPFGPREDTMASYFGTYWSNLAKYRNPNGNGTAPLPPLFWPNYNVGNRTNIILDVPLRLHGNLYGPECDFWDRQLEEGLWNPIEGLQRLMKGVWQ